MSNNLTFNYAKAERLLRILFGAFTILCAILGVLFLCLGKILAGILIICACFISSLLVSKMFICKLKNKFYYNKYKRVIYLLYYLLALAIVLATTFIFIILNTYSVEELSSFVIDNGKAVINAKLGNQVTFNEISVEDYFSYGSYCYFEIYFTYSVNEENKAEIYYAKINKNNLKVDSISSLEYVKSKSYFPN